MKYLKFWLIALLCSSATLSQAQITYKVLKVSEGVKANGKSVKVYDEISENAKIELPNDKAVCKIHNKQTYYVKKNGKLKDVKEKSKDYNMIGTKAIIGKSQDVVALFNQNLVIIDEMKQFIPLTIYKLNFAIDASEKVLYLSDGKDINYILPANAQNEIILGKDMKGLNGKTLELRYQNEDSYDVLGNVTLQWVFLPTDEIKDEIGALLESLKKEKLNRTETLQKIRNHIGEYGYIDAQHLEAWLKKTFQF